MPIIRESPRAQVSPTKNSTQWPPRSPFQALLSSPSGRRKWQERRSREVSPSPVKSASRGAAMDVRDGGDEEDDGEDGEDEDEETLQLQLRALETKLKLKKLQNAKKKHTSTSNGKEDESGNVCTAVSSRAESSPRRPGRSPVRVRGEIEVPVSPTHEREERVHTSPARARLGLDSKAQNVSLKRARDGTLLPRRNGDSRALGNGGHEEGTSSHTSRPAVSSFSERLAQSKVEAQERKEKDDRVEKARANGFGRRESGSARGLAQSPFLRDPSSGKANAKETRGNGAVSITKSSSTRTSTSERTSTHDTNAKSTTNRPRARSKTHNNVTDRPTNHHKATDSDSSISIQSASETTINNERTNSYYDPFSTLHLSKRHIPHPTLTRSLTGKELYTLPRLLKEVKSPDYDPPDCESDFVVFAILASKSSPYDQKASHRTSDENAPQEDAVAGRKKFMVLKLTDLEWEIDLFLFASAFDAFWKLTPGTVVAVLNPGIMPPKGGQRGRDSGRFCLKLGSSEDCILEIGTARDLGWCESVRADGRSCEAWVDRRKTGVCAFHLELAVEREGRRGRMEVNCMWRSHEGTTAKGRGGRGGRGGGGGRGGKSSGGNSTFDREYGQLYSVPTGFSAFGGGMGSAASILDAEDKLPPGEAEEASRKRIAAAQRERDLVRKLGQVGKGVGAEYFRSTAQQASSTSTAAGAEAGGGGGLFDKPSASALGLLANKPESTHLSPAKDRKRHFGLGAVSSAGSEAMGWGNARKVVSQLQAKQDSRVGSPEKGNSTLRNQELDRGRKPIAGIARGRSTDGSGCGSLSPTKKRARFALEKGIREPGRESLGQHGGMGDGDDDELDIV